MTRNIALRDKLYDRIMEAKGDKSFSEFIEGELNRSQKIDTISSLVQSIEKLKERVDKVELFVSEHAGGQY